MNLEIDYQAKVQVWRDKISKVDTDRENLKDKLLASLEKQDGETWQETYNAFNKLRENPQQDWSWKPHFMGFKNFVSKYISSRLGEWLKGFFKGSRLRETLEHNFENEINKKKQEIKLKKDDEILLQDLKYLFKKNLSAEIQPEEMQKLLKNIETKKFETDFAAYCEHLGKFAETYPKSFIDSYKDKLDIPYGDCWEGAKLHYWARAVMRCYFPKSTQVTPKFHAADKILLAFTQRKDEEVSATLPSQSLDAYYDDLKEELKNKLFNKLGHDNYSAIDTNGYNERGALDLPLNLLAQHTVAERCTKTKCLTEALGRAIIFEIAMADALENALTQNTNSNYHMAFKTKWTHALNKFCGLNDNIKSGEHILDTINPFHPSSACLPPALRHGEYLFNTIAKNWLDNLILPPEDIIHSFLVHCGTQKHYSQEDKIWLKHRLHQFYLRLESENTHTKITTSDKLKKTFNALMSTIDSNSPSIEKRPAASQTPTEATISSPVKFWDRTHATREGRETLKTENTCQPHSYRP